MARSKKASSHTSTTKKEKIEIEDCDKDCDKDIEDISVPTKSYYATPIYVTSGGYGQGACTAKEEFSNNHRPQENYFTIEVTRKSDHTSAGFRDRQKYYSEEEFVISFMNIYNGLQIGKKYCATGFSLVNLEMVESVIAKQNQYGIESLLSPLYIIEKAKEIIND